MPSRAKRHQAQNQVADFRMAMGQLVGSHPEIRDPELCARLIMEEAAETANALLGVPVSFQIGDDGPIKTKFDCERGRPDLVGVIDGVCDLLYVSYGAAVACGFNVAPYFNEVHRSNLAKAGGPIAPDGKRLKPEGWMPPNIAGILADELKAKS